MSFLGNSNKVPSSLGRRHGTQPTVSRASSLLGHARIFLCGFVTALVLVKSLQNQEQMGLLLTTTTTTTTTPSPELLKMKHDARLTPTPIQVVGSKSLLQKNKTRLDTLQRRAVPVKTEQPRPLEPVAIQTDQLQTSQKPLEVQRTTTPVENNRSRPSSQVDHGTKKETSVTKSTRMVTTVFSTSCSTFQDWQSQALVHNHRQMGIPGDLVRLMACDDPSYVMPQHNTTRYPRYRVVRVPDFNKKFVDQGHVNYSPRNRPASMEYWLAGLSEDGQINIPKGHDHIVVAVDPDHLFLDGKIWYLDHVRQGHGVAALYAMGEGWVDEWGAKLCNPPTKCQGWKEKGVNAEFGHPIVFTAQDALTHAKVWFNMTNDIKQLGHKAWESEMYTAVLAAIYTDIQVKVQPFMISNRVVNTEPWDRLQWKKKGDETSSLLIPDENPDNKLPMLIGHYCQQYTVSSNYSFFKHHLARLDIRKCDKNDGKIGRLETPSLEDQQRMEARRYKPLRVNDQMSQEELEQSRDAWMIDHVVEPIREALQVYDQDYCK